MADRQFKPKFELPHGAQKDPYKIDTTGFITWKNARNGFMVAVAHYTSDPEKRSQEWFRETTKTLSQDKIDREYEIDFSARAGKLAFPYLQQFPERWQIPDMDLKAIPRHWRIIAGLDYGTTNATSCHLYALNEKNVLHSVYEFYKPSSSAEIAKFLRGEHPDYPHPLWRRIEKIVADPAIFRKTQEKEGGEAVGSVAELIKGHLRAQHLYPGINERLAGLDRLIEMFNFKPNDPSAKPRILFCKNCKFQWRDLSGMIWDELPPHLLLNKNAKEDVVAKDDHGYDEARYVCMSLNFPAGGPEAEKPKVGTLAEVEKHFDRTHDDGNGPDFF